MKFIDELIDEVHFIGATRPDGSSAIDSTLDELGSKAREKIHVMEVPEMKLSATYLRALTVWKDRSLYVA